MEKKIQKITPFLWFNNQAEEAVEFYTSIFPDSKATITTRYGAEGAEASGMPMGTVMTVEFQLAGLSFVALNGGPSFKFTEAISFVVCCDSQDEINHYWNKLSEGGDPNAQMCGWLKDKFGVSWQIVPSTLGELLNNPERASNVMKALLRMKKIDVAALKSAYEEQKTA